MVSEHDYFSETVRGRWYNGHWSYDSWSYNPPKIISLTLINLYIDSGQNLITLQFSSKIQPSIYTNLLRLCTLQDESVEKELKLEKKAIQNADKRYTAVKWHITEICMTFVPVT